MRCLVTTRAGSQPGLPADVQSFLTTPLPPLHPYACSPAPSHRKVDIAAEARQQRSRVLQSALNTHVVPALQRLAAAPLGGGRAQQMLTRIQGL